MLVNAEERAELRCHRCSKFLALAAEHVRIVALFKPSFFGRVFFGLLPGMRGAEVRKRCESCGWVNVFHPHSGNTEAA